ncbi:MAG: alpha-galactosidase [Pseudomonadota bacterium]
MPPPLTDAARVRSGSDGQQIDWLLQPGAAPRWAHWGCAFGGEIAAAGDPLPPATLDSDPRLDLCPVEGSGWMHQPALQGFRPSAAGNLDWAPAWTGCELTRHGADVSVVLESGAAGLRWEQRWSLAAGGALWTVTTSIENLGTTPYQLCWLAAVTLPLPPQACRVLTLGGPWAGEFKEHWDELPGAMFRRDNRRGRSSHDCFPGVMIGGAGLGEDHGEGWALHLGFSGSHSMLIEPLTDGRRQLQAGELLHGGEQLLAPGQRYSAPPAYAAYSTRGLAGLSAAFHAVLRDQILQWPDGARAARPVHINTWEALYFDHDYQRLAALAKAAAAVGVERFVLDDGWFHGRAHDRAGLGDWWPDRAKYPDGLEPLANLVDSLGMQFGLWVEPEMVNPDSELYRAHPEWALAVPGDEPLLGRNQLVLDLTLPDVSDYLFDKIDLLLRETPIRYLKWDMNRDMGPGASKGRAVHGAQVRALYRLFERVRAAHPRVEIESCASGGGRADFAILAHTHRLWTSDCNDALERVAIQRGFLRFFPPEIMGAHIGPAPAHTTGRSHRIDFRAAVALIGHCGIEADVSTMDAAERERLAAWIEQHKRLRGVMHGAAVHQGDIVDGVTYTACWSEAQQAGVLCVFRTAAAHQRYQTPLQLPWLAAIPSLIVRAAPVNDVALPEGWGDLAEGRAMAGSTLAAAGLPLPPMRAESAWIVELSLPPI